VIIANMIRKLNEAGANIEAIIIAVEALEEELAAKRLAAAERQRRSRASRHVTSRDITETPPLVSPLRENNPPSDPTPSEPIGSVSERGSDGQSVEKRGRRRHEYPADFEAFWQAYPTDANMSKTEAGAAWKRLSAEDRKLAADSIPGFLAYCQAHADYRPIHANRYLLKRRFDGHLAKAKEQAQWTDISRGDPSWDAWLAHYRDGGRKFYLKTMLEAAEQNKPFRVPTLWPPTVKRDAA
jgi:hypothetical protein